MSVVRRPDLEKQALEPLAAVERHVEFDPRLVAERPHEIGAAHQRPVDAGRGHFEPVFARDRVLEVEHRRQRPAGRLAILDRHRAVGPLGHDLQRRRDAARASPAPAAARDRLSTGPATWATRAATPVSVVRRGSSSAADLAGFRRCQLDLTVAHCHRLHCLRRQPGKAKERVRQEPTL